MNWREAEKRIGLQRYDAEKRSEMLWRRGAACDALLCCDAEKRVGLSFAGPRQ